MTDAAAGDVCPECGTPFDPRPDAPRAWASGLLSLGSGSFALVCCLATLSVNGMIAMVVAFAIAADVHHAPDRYRVHPRDRIRARLGASFAAAGLAVLVLYRLYALVAPESMRWW